MLWPSAARRSVRPWRLVLGLMASNLAVAGDQSFFTTYTPQMDDPGTLEITTKAISGKPAGERRFLGGATEFEYSANTWWTTELTLGARAGAIGQFSFTGYEWENRFRLLRHEHWTNPVLDVEFESLKGADETLLDEVSGHEGTGDLIQLNRDVERSSHEVEASLILGSSFKSWTIAENLIAEKDVGHSPFEFGYALGAIRGMAPAGHNGSCGFCLRNLQLGFEMYGGLGDWGDLGFHNTSHYFAPLVGWTLPNGIAFRVSPAFGLTRTSAPCLLRFDVSYSVDGFGRTARKMFHGQPLAN